VRQRGRACDILRLPNPPIKVRTSGQRRFLMKIPCGRRKSRNLLSSPESWSIWSILRIFILGTLCGDWHWRIDGGRSTWPWLSETQLSPTGTGWNLTTNFNESICPLFNCHHHNYRVRGSVGPASSKMLLSRPTPWFESCRLLRLEPTEATFEHSRMYCNLSGFRGTLRSRNLPGRIGKSWCERLLQFFIFL